MPILKRDLNKLETMSGSPEYMIGFSALFIGSNTTPHVTNVTESTMDPKRHKKNKMQIGIQHRKSVMRMKVTRFINLYSISLGVGVLLLID